MTFTYFIHIIQCLKKYIYTIGFLLQVCTTYLLYMFVTNTMVERV